jgi:hypothetical protein
MLGRLLGLQAPQAVLLSILGASRAGGPAHGVIKPGPEKPPSPAAWQALIALVFGG